MQIQKVLQIGNSAGVLVPREWRQELGINVGDEIALQKEAGKITIVPHRSKAKKYRNGLTLKFAQMVDEFIEDHKDVLQELANR